LEKRAFSGADSPFGARSNGYGAHFETSARELLVGKYVAGCASSPLIVLQWTYLNCPEPRIFRDMCWFAPSFGQSG